MAPGSFLICGLWWSHSTPQRRQGDCAMGRLGHRPWPAVPSWLLSAYLRFLDIFTTAKIVLIIYIPHPIFSQKSRPQMGHPHGHGLEAPCRCRVPGPCRLREWEVPGPGPWAWCFIRLPVDSPAQGILRTTCYACTLV